MQRTIFKTLFLLFLFNTQLQGQNYPYPQSVSFNHCIKPGGVTSEIMNASVGQFYDYWKQKYLKTKLVSLPGGYYVASEITGNPQGFKPLGTSEGLGYGMIITAIMAGYDKDARMLFDGLFKTARAFHSKTNPALMGWVVADDKKAQGAFGSATDGDLDIAYALILAHLQWTSNGSIHYFNEAKAIIEALETANITLSKRLNLGDWQSKSTSATRPSDWMTAHMQLFHTASGKKIWLDLRNNAYDLVEALQANYAATTGLLPDFAWDNPIKPVNPDFLEGPNDGNFYYNACRVPLRLILDYAHNDEPRAKIALERMMDWIIIQTSNKPALVKAGYSLRGEVLPGSNYFDAVFVAPLVAAAISDEKYQHFLTAGWPLLTRSKSNYFADTINLLCQLGISGNWWAPKLQSVNSPDLHLQQGSLVFPNPVVDRLFFSPDGLANGMAQIFNLVGQEVLSFNPHETQYVDVGHLKSGVYIFKAFSTMQNRHVTAKFTKW